MVRDSLETENDVRLRVKERLNARRELVIHAIIFIAAMAGLWMIALVTGSGLWPLWVLLGWGAGLSGHAVEVFYKAGPPALRREQLIWREMAERYGDDWRETATRADYDAVRRRVSEPFNKRKELVIHGVVFALINLMLWIIWLSSGGFPWPALVTLFWGVGLVAHGVEALAYNRQERAVERELARELDRLEAVARTEKRKRHEVTVELTDDGELVELIDGYDTEPKRKRG